MTMTNGKKVRGYSSTEGVEYVWGYHSLTVAALMLSADKDRLRGRAGGQGPVPCLCAALRRLSMTYDGWYETHEKIDLLVAPEIIPEPAAVEVLDGRSVTFKVFRQRGNQGGGEVSMDPA
jgi:hypothetical protein